MTAKKRSEWTEREVQQKVRDWCVAHDIRGYFKMRGDTTLCGMFLAPVDQYYGHTAQGRVLYHRGYTRLYDMSEEKLRRFFSSSNLAYGGFVGGIFTVRMPKLHWLDTIDNSKATPFDEDAYWNERYGSLYEGASEGSVYIRGKKPQYKHNTLYHAPEPQEPIQRTSKKATGKLSKAELHARPWTPSEDEILRCHYAEHGEDMSFWSRQLKGRRRVDIRKRVKELGLDLSSS